MTTGFVIFALMFILATREHADYKIVASPDRARNITHLVWRMLKSLAVTPETENATDSEDEKWNLNQGLKCARNRGLYL